ncbi:hypothetical protein WAI453_007634 [Rhynchosporium graminicola]
MEEKLGGGLKSVGSASLMFCLDLSTATPLFMQPHVIGDTAWPRQFWSPPVQVGSHRRVNMKSDPMILEAISTMRSTHVNSGVVPEANSSALLQNGFGFDCYQVSITKSLYVGTSMNSSKRYVNKQRIYQNVTSWLSGLVVTILASGNTQNLSTQTCERPRVQIPAESTSSVIFATLLLKIISLTFCLLSKKCWSFCGASRLNDHPLGQNFLST